MKDVVIDLGIIRKGGTIDEGVYRQMGASIEYMMSQMFGNKLSDVGVKVRGTTGEIAAFAEVLKKEKKYLTVVRELGTSSSLAYKTKYELDSAIREFKRKTGLDWMFK